jgi:tetratricopeptide (TPR) repeat protein
MKRALITGGLLLGLALAAPKAQAQTGSARGRVIDGAGQPVLEATVLIEFQGGVTRKFEVKLNKKGEYMQVGLQPGMYRFTASKAGYQSAVVDYKVQLGDPTAIPDLKMQTQAAAAAQPGSQASELRAAFQAAVGLTNEGKYDEAEAAYKAMLAKTPDIPEVYQNLGYVYTQKKDWANAEASYEKALELHPGATDIMTALARAYQDSGNPQKAMELMTKAASDNPQDAKAQFNKGVFLLNSGQSPEATAAFEAAVKADPAMAEAYYYLGTLMVGQGKIPESISYLEKYLGMNPTNTQNVATAQGLLKALKK